MKIKLGHLFMHFYWVHFEVVPTGEQRFFMTNNAGAKDINHNPLQKIIWARHTQFSLN